MNFWHQRRRVRFILLAVLATLLLAACNLGAGPEQSADSLTAIPTDTSVAATRTPLPNEVSGVVTVTPIPFPTRATTITQPTSVAILPPVQPIIPTNTPAPVGIFILSPSSGNIVAGSIQVLGSAIHPQFLQYRLEYGPEPNVNNLWLPITGIVQSPVLSGILGIWNTTTGATPDGLYQLRLRVFLRDGRQEITSVSNIRVQNQAPTPVPTNTPTVPRPIAAFTQDVASGNAPLTVRFTNQSQGQINSYLWTFGDGTTSSEINPVKTFTQAGAYLVTLTVTGAGGVSNVSRTISVSSINPPVASFIVDKSSGEAPLTVVFTNRSTGNINSFFWDFGDGETSTQTSPTHTFTSVGTYNVILEARGDGGTTQVVRQITVNNPQIPAPVAQFAPNVTEGNTPLTVTFSNTSTGNISQYLWDFNNDGVTDSTDVSPTHTFTAAGEYTVRLTVIGAGGQANASAVIRANTPPAAPIAGFTANPETGFAPLTVQFTNTTTGNATGFVWDLNGDGQPDSTETNPVYTYAQGGTYTVRLIANGDGGSTQAERVISVQQPVQAPQASFVASPTAGDAPLQVFFSNTTTGNVDNYAWDFNGDGITDSTDVSPSFTYATPGTYTVTLTASNSGGATQASAVITVTDAPPPPPMPTGNIVFVSNRDGNNDIWVANQDGSNAVNITNSGANDRDPVWSPDGGRIVFVSDRDGNDEIYVFDVATLNTTRLTFTNESDTSPVWSPNGAEIAFTSNRDGDNDIWVMNADGSNARAVTFDTTDDTTPAWSLDGSRIVYVSDGNLFVVNLADTSTQPLLADGSFNASPSWFGDTVVFASTRSGSWDIWSINVNDPDNTLTQLTGGAGNNQFPRWNASGSEILFTSDRDGSNNIYRMNPDGSNQFALFISGANDSNPSGK